MHQVRNPKTTAPQKRRTAAASAIDSVRCQVALLIQVDILALMREREKSTAPTHHYEQSSDQRLTSDLTHLGSKRRRNKSQWIDFYWFAKAHASDTRTPT